MNKKGMLLSGGMDSISIAYWKKPEVAITIDYGQKAAEAEITVSSKICEILGIEHHVLKIDCSRIGSGDLSDNIALSIAPKSDWWPYRNQLLITLAAPLALKLELNELMLGTVKNDGYHRDGSSEFYNKISELMLLQEGNLTISAPAIELTASELIKISGVPNEILLWAHSCHKSVIACRNCRGCNKYYSLIEELQFAN